MRRCRTTEPWRSCNVEHALEKADEFIPGRHPLAVKRVLSGHLGRGGRHRVRKSGRRRISAHWLIDGVGVTRSFQEKVDGAGWPNLAPVERRPPLRQASAMVPLPTPLTFFVLLFSGWVNRHQQAVIDYLLEENRVLRAVNSSRRLREGCENPAPRVAPNGVASIEQPVDGRMRRMGRCLTALEASCSSRSATWYFDTFCAWPSWVVVHTTSGSWKS